MLLRNRDRKEEKWNQHPAGFEPVISWSQVMRSRAAPEFLFSKMYMILHAQENFGPNSGHFDSFQKVLLYYIQQYFINFLPGTEEYPLIKNMGPELNPIAQELSSQKCCREGKKDKCWTIKQNAAHRQRMHCTLMFSLLHLIRFCFLASINYIH